MRPTNGIRLLLLSLACACTATAARHPAPNTSDATASAKATQTWDKAAAAKYLDSRQVWWQDWPHAQKDHGTVCVSCHTQVPYALARPLLRQQLGEQKISAPERAMLDSIITRVKLGNEAETFYSDAVHGPGKTREARNAEAVNNAVILTSYDAQSGHLQPETRKALDAMWALQEPTGPVAGAWVWQNFHFSPWEAPESEYWGATMAAFATATAPDRYADDPKIQSNLNLLRAYLRSHAAAQPLVNRITLLWASSKLPDLMTRAERKSLVAEILKKQQPDGGWSLTSLGEGTWKRHDKTPFDLRSDGFATGIVVLALEENNLDKKSPELKRGLTWLIANQNKTSGQWPAWSVNVQRDPNSEVGKFMSDAATGFSILALEHRH
jgi:hypothetical protein